VEVVAVVGRRASPVGGTDLWCDAPTAACGPTLVDQISERRPQLRSERLSDDIGWS